MELLATLPRIDVGVILAPAAAGRFITEGDFRPMFWDGENEVYVHDTAPTVRAGKEVGLAAFAWNTTQEVVPPGWNMNMQIQLWIYDPNGVQVAHAVEGVNNVAPGAVLGLEIRHQAMIGGTYTVEGQLWGEIVY